MDPKNVPCKCTKQNVTFKINYLISSDVIIRLYLIKLNYNKDIDCEMNERKLTRLPSCFHRVLTRVISYTEQLIIVFMLALQ